MKGDAVAIECLATLGRAITARRLGTTSVTLRVRGFDPVTWVVEVIPGGIAIDHNLGFQTAVLLISVDIFQLVKLPQLCKHLWSPLIQVIEAFGLQRVLILRVARAATDLQILR